MKGLSPIFLVSIVVFVLFCTSMEEGHSDKESLYFKYADSSLVNIEFSFDVNRDVYKYSNYGEPPQVAIWLENPDSQLVKTVWVSDRAGRNDWKGKFECPVALPFWESRHQLEKSTFRERNLLERLIDAITGATPKEGKFTARIEVPKGSPWIYYIEVNVSGDYNKTFPYWSTSGAPDTEGNGQPSIVYQGNLIAEVDSFSIPKLIGRTEQRKPIDYLVHELDGITLAKEVVNNLKVLCKSDAK